MKSFTLAFAAMAVFLPAVASVGNEGFHGPDCVRDWTVALKTTPPPNSIGGDMRRVYANTLPFMRQQADPARRYNPVDVIAQMCRLDRAITLLIINDEVEASGLPQEWNLPTVAEGLPEVTVLPGYPDYGGPMCRSVDSHGRAVNTCAK
jgi:hypothetical protein